MAETIPIRGVVTVEGEAARRPLAGVTSDANRSTIHEGVSTPEVKWFDLEGMSRSLSVQNTGGETIWFSFDKERWHYIMAGTSWCGAKVAMTGFWHCTQTGTTRFAVGDVAM